MKRGRVWQAVYHSSIVFSVVFLILFTLDRVNPAMGFLGSDQGDWLLFVFSLCSFSNWILSAVYLIRRQGHAQKRKRQPPVPNPPSGQMPENR